MKKNLYFAGLLMSSAFTLNAQITLTQASNAPASGDIESYKYLDSTATLPKSAGANQTWDYTASVINSTNTAVSTTNYTTATSIPGASMFISAGANVAATDSSIFLKSTSTTLEDLGAMYADGSVMYLSNSLIMVQFPFTYGNSFTDNFSGTYTITSLGTINLNGNVNTNADAYGTVILPATPSNLTFNNVLRVKQTTTMNISGILSGTIISTNYMYLKSGTKNPFLQIQYQYANIPAFGSPSNDYTILYDVTLPVGIEQISNNNVPSVFVYPNPSKDVLNVQMNQADYRMIQIIDIQGKLVKEIKLGADNDSSSIDIKDLQAGEYVLLLLDSKSGLSNISYKFIKE